jgi:hypothetical protein
MFITRQHCSTLILAAVLAGAALTLGCNDVPPPISGRQDPYPRMQITYASDDLRNTTAVGVPNPTRDEFGTLIVSVDIRDTTNHPFPIDYQVTWFDKNGQRLSQESWQTKTLEANVQDQILVKGPPLAADFQFDFRDAK